MSAGRRRFYRETAADLSPNPNGYRVLLDGRPLKTPLGAPLLLPVRGLAEAVAEEWRRQGETIRPETMILTKLANTAIDRVAQDRHGAQAQILGFARSDLICYRAEAPVELTLRQSAAWDPLLTWAEERFGATLRTGSGIAFVAQPEETIAALERALASRDDFAVAGLQTAAQLTGSAVIALALAEGRLEAEAAFAASHLDEIYQVERWGSDSEAQTRRETVKNELIEMASYFRLFRG